MKVLSVVIIVAFSLCAAAVDPLCMDVPPGEVYYFPYPGDCNLFVSCLDGLQTVETCPDDLWFSESLQACVFSYQSECIDIVCPPGVVDFFPDFNDCTSYIECYHGVPERHSCPTELWFNAREKRCVGASESGCGEYSTSVEPTWTTPTPACWGVIPGRVVLRPYPGDCSKFIQCVGAQETLMSCPYPYYFNSERQMCIQQELSGCDASTGTADPSTTTATTTDNSIDDPRCADGNSNYWPLDDCTRFIECSNGRGYSFICPEGLYYDPDKVACVDPSESSCGRTTPTVNPDTTTRGGDFTVDPDCIGNPNYLFPYPGNCTLFMECANDVKVVQECPPTLWFSPTLLVCDYPYHAGCRYQKNHEE